MRLPARASDRRKSGYIRGCDQVASAHLLRGGHPFGSLLRREFFNEPPSEGSIEVRYSYTACLLAEAGLGVALVDSFTSIHGNRYKIDVRPLRPSVSVDAT